MAKSEVFNCDCVEYMRTLPDNAFSLAIADPPYGDGNSQIGGAGGLVEGSTAINKTFVNHAGGADLQDTTVSRTGGTWAARYGKKIVGWDEAPTQEFFKELFRVSEHQIIWGANYFDNMPATRCFIVWRKLTISENFTMAMAEYAWTSFAANAKVFECAPQQKAGDARFHPTQKPVELYAWLMKNYAKAGQTIFDPMMGSQSSRIAAYRLGFDYVGCELDKEYFDKGCERYERECLGITRLADGRTLQQLTLF